MEVSAPYFKIETFATLDGPGTRLLIFLQGCPWRCLYCHNPESWGLVSTKTITVQEVIEMYERNKEFYKNGGITISGGEPLLHQDFCLALAKECNKRKISLAIDTSGATYNKTNLPFFKKLMKYSLLWMVDIKQLNNDMHKLLVGEYLILEKDLIQELDQQKQKYWIRHVLIDKYTNNEENLKNIGIFLSTLKNLSHFELLPFKKYATNKYRELGIKYPVDNIKETSGKQIEKAYKLIKKYTNIKK